MTSKRQFTGEHRQCKGLFDAKFCPVKNWPKFVFWGKIGSKCKIFFSGPPKGTSLRQTTSFDVLIVIIGAVVLALDKRTHPKN